MYNNRRLAVSIFWIVLGIVLFVLGICKVVDDMWQSVGIAFVFIGALQVSRNMRYRKDEDYKEKVDVAVSDERNRYIRLKAWAYAGCIFVVVSAVASIGFRVAGQTEKADVTGMCLCFVIFVYWLSYYVLQRKE